MPEAVASNSTPMPEGQRPLHDAFDLIIALEASADTFHALGEMVARQLEQVDERMSIGLGFLFRREVSDLEESLSGLRRLYQALHVADRATADMAEAMEEQAADAVDFGRVDWPDLWNAVRDLTADVMQRAGMMVPADKAYAMWTDSQVEKLEHYTAENFEQIMTMLDGSRDPFEAGGLLPWLEVRFMRRLRMEPDNVFAAPVLERSSVQRIMDRLTTKEDQVRNVNEI